MLDQCQNILLKLKQVISSKHRSLGIMRNGFTDKKLKFQGFLWAHLASSVKKTTIKGGNLLFLCSSCLLLRCAEHMARGGRKYVQASKAILKNPPNLLKRWAQFAGLHSLHRHLYQRAKTCGLSPPQEILDLIRACLQKHHENMKKETNSSLVLRL